MHPFPGGLPGAARRAARYDRAPMTRSTAPLVLVVEDDPDIAAMQQERLQAAGMRVLHLARGDVVEAAVRAESPDLVILDVVLPGLDGTEVSRALRRFSEVPIIMVTARADEGDRLLGFDVGADDYLCKPFSPRELVARVQALLRRRGIATARAPAPAPAVAIVTVDMERQRASCLGRPLEPTPQELRLLAALVAQPGRVFSRAQLLELAYDDPSEVFDRAIDSHIKNLRKKFAAIAPDRAFIHSVYGLGYRYEPQAAPGKAATAADVARVPLGLKDKLPKFLAARRALIDEMAQALDAGERAAAARIAHRLAGSFALYGFATAGRQCLELERDAEGGTAAELRGRIEAVRRGLETVELRFVEDDAAG